MVLLLEKMVVQEVAVQRVKRLVHLWVESVQPLKSVPALKKKNQAVAAVVAEAAVVCLSQLTKPSDL